MNTQEDLQLIKNVESIEKVERRASRLVLK